VNYSLHFRRAAGPKLLNKYMCYEVNFQKYDRFPQKVLNSAAKQLILSLWSLMSTDVLQADTTCIDLGMCST